MKPTRRKIDRRVGRLLGMNGHIDVATGNRVSGWAFAGKQPIIIEAMIGDRVVASTTPNIIRHDVALAYPGTSSAGLSGFMLEIPDGAILGDHVSGVAIFARQTKGWRIKTELVTFPIANAKTIARVAEAPETNIVGVFPRQVINAVAALWPDTAADLICASGQRRFADKLLMIFKTPELRSTPAIADYARYLQTTWAHCNFVDTFFPTSNPTSKRNSADFHCKPNSAFELFSIVHQLYVLKSYGIQGDFAEFGCFKGFSSAMLSFACQALGITMHIFDSFEGLPPSESSGYAAGDYAGSLEEVRTNVERFGAISVVEFHKGFFSDTFKTYRPPSLMSLWMDVDLESSSRDLMVVADQLDSRATLFSHECAPDMFKDGEIMADPSPDNPIPPVLSRFDDLGRPLTGRFLHGNTGAFWPREGGIPAIDNAVLMEMIRQMH